MSRLLNLTWFKTFLASTALASTDFKLACFFGKTWDFTAWLIKLVALKYAKELFRRVIGNEDLTEAKPTLHQNSNDNQKTVYKTIGKS